MPTIPHLAWPPTLVPAPGGTVVLEETEQDTPVEIRQSVALLCELRPGRLPWAPELGIPDPLASSDPDMTAAQITAALTGQEPRARINARADHQNGRQVQITVEVPE